MKKSIMRILSLLTGIIGATVVTKEVMGKRLNIQMHYAKKHLDLFLMMNQWVKVKQKGKNLSSYFENNNFKRIAIYGMSYVGETLVEELEDTGIEVAYGIDRNADEIFHFVKIVPAKGELEDVDAVIVTAVSFFDDIRDMLCEKLECPIISLEKILYEV